jgi:hypothetical protein
MHYRNLQMITLTFLGGVVVGIASTWVGILCWVLMHDGANR